MEKIVRACHYNKLRIAETGAIYPCCLSIPHTKLGTIFEDDIFKKIEDAEVICECELFKSVPKAPDAKPTMKYLHVELSNVCQATCVCCPQTRRPLANEDVFLGKIREFVEHYQPENITALGGEILVQKKTMEFLSKLKKDFPNIKFHTISNLSVSMDMIKLAEEIFETATISFLGFQPFTYSKEMGLDFETTMRNFNYLYENKKVKLMPKFLTMPSNLFELELFFKWAIGLDVPKIYLHNIKEFKQVANLDTVYWQRSFVKLEKAIKKIFEENKEYIQSKKNKFIAIHPIICDYLHIDSAYLSENGFEGIVYKAN